MERGPCLRGTAGLFAAAMGLALAAYFVSASSALAQGMAVPGDISVSETGAASYTIPIAVPPGTAGMVPSLSLSYNSHGGNGLLGMGWQLEGLAAIGRCARTLAQDGARGSINYDANDRFCLDGQRLVAISGTYGADGTEYRTEIESFTKVISRGTAGTGPAWFEVWTKSGQRMEFGNSADSRILAQGKPSARSWAVNKVADTKGNFYAVSYVNDAANGEAYPSRIDYTGNAAAGLSPYNSVRFVYEARPDVATAWHVGSMSRSTVRMTKLRTYAGDALVSDYRLTYAQGASTGRSQFTSVTACEAGGACLPASRFGWTIGVDEMRKTVSDDQKIFAYSSVVATGDFNGDGLTDFYTIDPAEPNLFVQDESWSQFLHLSNGDGTFTRHAVPHEGKIATYNSVVATGDFNGDGLTDFYTIDPAEPNLFVQDGSWRQYVHLSNGDGTFTRNTVADAGKIAGQQLVVATGDFNGDGLTDIYTLDPVDAYSFPDDSNAVQYVHLSLGDGTFTRASVPDDGKIAAWQSVAATGDFNGDGLTDFYTIDPEEPNSFLGTGATQYLHLSNGDGTFTRKTVPDAGKILVQQLVVTTGDFNGDGLTDIYTLDPVGAYSFPDDSNAAQYVHLSLGDGTFTRASVPNDRKIAAWQSVAATGDFNGDGLTDFYTIDPEEPNSFLGAGATQYLHLSNGDGTFTRKTVPDAGKIPAQQLVVTTGDFNGDGLTDIYTLDPDGSSTYPNDTNAPQYVHLSIGVPDILSAVTDGLGANTSVTYKSMTDSSVYTKDRGENAASYPVVDIQAPMQMTARIQQSDGIGGTRDSTYRYAGAKLDMNGRGFLGFREMIARDERTGIAQTTTYRQDFPFTGLVASDVQSKDSLTLSAAVNTHAATDLGGTRRQVRLAQSVTTGADLDGAILPSVTTSYQYDAFGNATQITVTNADGFSKVTTNSYTNDVSKWLLGRLIAATVTSQAAAVAEQPSGVDATPAAFSFEPVSPAQVSTSYQTSALISGFNVALTAQVSGGGAQIRKNDVGDWGTAILVLPGDRLNLRMTSSAALDATVTATVAIGGVSATWSITTFPRLRTITVSSNVNNLNLRALHDSIYPAPANESPPVQVSFLIQPGVIVGSTSTAAPALDVGDWPAGVPVTLDIRGRIQGAGGQGGNAATSTSYQAGYVDGQAGGTALYARRAFTLNLNGGKVWGGGGGGGGGRIKDGGKRAGSGGGGSGQLPGQPGAKGNGGDDTVGQPGTTDAGGLGGSASTGEAGGGAAGGNPGLKGGDTNISGRTSFGGAAGAAIDGASVTTQTGSGDIRGAQIN